jgi:two-component system chemotaxis response regulator CheY
LQLAPSRILIVDDDADIRLTLTDCLEFDGYEVAQACDGLAALQALEAAPLPDVILLDLMMPRMDGREFLSRLRADARFRGVPVIVMTAAAPVPAASLGADAFLRKPFDLSRLCELVAAHCLREAALTAAGA